VQQSAHRSRRVTTRFPLLEFHRADNPMRIPASHLAEEIDRRELEIDLDTRSLRGNKNERKPPLRVRARASFPTL